MKWDKKFEIICHFRSRPGEEQDSGGTNRGMKILSLLYDISTFHNLMIGIEFTLRAADMDVRLVVRIFGRWGEYVRLFCRLAGYAYFYRLLSRCGVGWPTELWGRCVDRLLEVMGVNRLHAPHHPPRLVLSPFPSHPTCPVQFCVKMMLQLYNFWSATYNFLLVYTL